MSQNQNFSQDDSERPPILTPGTQSDNSVDQATEKRQTARLLHVAINAAQAKQYELAVEYLDYVLRLKPDYHLAALLKLLILFKSGTFFQHLSHPTKRRQLAKNLVGALISLRILWLILLSIALLSIFRNHPIVSVFKETLSVLISIAIFSMIIHSLWIKRSQLNFVWATYFKSGFLAYVRAFLIVVITTVAGVWFYLNSPIFMQVGWSQLIFSNSGNILLQPLHVIEQISRSPGDQTLKAPESDQTSAEAPTAPESSSTPEPSVPSHQQPAHVETSPHTSTPHPIQANHRVYYKWGFVALFWLLLVLILPFWAQLEEKMFRQGIVTWRGMIVRSIQFGLMHLIAGIPLSWALTLAIPGFLFACRYKYVYHRSFKQVQNELRAQEVAVNASTADHAIYNAILITVVSAVMVLTL